MERGPFGCGGGILVWAGIVFHRRTELHAFLGGTVTARRHGHKVLQQLSEAQSAQTVPSWTIMRVCVCVDNLGDEFLQGEDIHCMDWTARFPDMNPMEHAWDPLGRRVAARRLPPGITPELRTALREERDQLPMELLDHLEEGMSSHCEVCVTVRGNHTTC